MLRSIRSVIEMMSRDRRWMQERKVVAFRAFSSEDACDMPEGWEKPDDFTLDQVVCYDGEGYHVFGDPADSKFIIRKRSVPVKGLDELKKWLNDLDEGTILIGYGSEKFDLPLISESIGWEEQSNLTHYDLLEAVGEATADHYESHPRRFRLHNLAVWNKVKQDVLPILYYLFTPWSIIGAWKEHRRQQVVRTLAADALYLIRLLRLIEKNGSLRFRSEITDKLVRLDIESPFNHA